MKIQTQSEQYGIFGSPKSARVVSASRPLPDEAEFESMMKGKRVAAQENPYGDAPWYREHPDMNLLLNKAISGGNPLETMMSLQTMKDPPEWASDLKERALASPDESEDQSIHDELLQRYRQQR